MSVETTELQKKIGDGFKSSAYRGATGKLQSVEPDDTISRDGLRFAQLISNKLEPFPLRKHNQLQHQSDFVPGTTNNKTHTLRDAIPRPIAPTQTSTDGVVATGLRDSRGFLETMTSTQRMKGAFDNNVMDAYKTGVALEADLEASRQALQNAPLQTEKPNPWKKSTHDHSNFSKVDEESYRASYRSRHNLVSGSGDGRQEVHSQILKGNSVDRDALTDHLQKIHQQTLPRGYRAPSGSKWQTTTNATFSRFDLNTATDANSKFATQPHHKDNDCEPIPERRMGEHLTEASQSYAWRGAADQDTRFRHHGALDIVNGVHTMSVKYHHPRSDVCTNTTYKPSEIVQGQYVPTSKLSMPAKN
jgi:hypothetical protein